MKYIKEKLQLIFLREWEKPESILWFAMGVFAAAFILTMFWKSAAHTVGNLLGIDAKIGKVEILKFIGLGMGGLLAAIGAIALNRRAEAQTKVAEEQAKNNRLTEKGHIQDRFKTATEHLGHSRSGMRIAAYYEFYQLARENQDLRKIIFDMLCAHLRQITTASNYKGKTKPTEGVQTLLDLLFKTEDSKTIFRGLKANLQRVHLVGADLVNAYLENAILHHANLQYADLTIANLRNAHLAKAKMHGAFCMNAKMESASMYKAQLQGSFLLYACLYNARMDRANIQGASLMRAELQAASLNKADLRGAGLYETYLQGACFLETRLGGATPHNIMTVSVSKSRYTSATNTVSANAGTFAACINEGIGKVGDLSECYFHGGVSADRIEEIAKHLSGRYAKHFRDTMQEHDGNLVKGPEAVDISVCRNIILDPYSREDADEWIAEYKKATGETSGDGK